MLGEIRRSGFKDIFSSEKVGSWAVDPGQGRRGRASDDVLQSTMCNSFCINQFTYSSIQYAEQYEQYYLCLSPPCFPFLSDFICF